MKGQNRISRGDGGRSEAGQMLSFEQALSIVQEQSSRAAREPGEETVSLASTSGRLLAEDLRADRDYPPFHRSTRDGYAVRASDLGTLPATLDCRGQVRAGDHFGGSVQAGQCLEIMTGAPLPEGADAVVMVEYTRAQGARVEIQRAVEPGENVVRRGSEAPAGAVVLKRGRRLGAGEVALLAALGKASVRVFARPRVGILPTGDEVVPVESRPEWFQVRNSNAHGLAAQVRVAGGEPCLLGIAPDRKESLRELIRASHADLLILSGGVSMGKYDLVKQVLGELGAQFFFHGVAIRPGKPLLFGRLGGTLFFGLPGNPVSTYVTFELFARPAISVLGGGEFAAPVFLRARLARPFRPKAELTFFMPARVEMNGNEPVVSLVGWQGSGDLVGVVAANCFLVAHPVQKELAAGDWVDVLPKGH